MEKSPNPHGLAEALETVNGVKGYKKHLQKLKWRNMIVYPRSIFDYMSYCTAEKKLDILDFFKEFIEAKIKFARALQHLEQQLKEIEKSLNDVILQLPSKFHIDAGLKEITKSLSDIASQIPPKFCGDAVLKKDSKTSKPQRRDIKIQPDTLIEFLGERVNLAVLEEGNLAKAFQLMTKLRSFDKCMNLIKNDEERALAELEEAHKKYIGKQLELSKGAAATLERDTFFCIVGLSDKTCSHVNTDSIIHRAIETEQKYSEVFQKLKPPVLQNLLHQKEDYDQYYLKVDVSLRVVPEIDELRPYGRSVLKK